MIFSASARCGCDAVEAGWGADRVSERRARKKYRRLSQRRLMGRGRAGVGTHHARVAARGVEGVHDLVEEGHIEGLVEVEELLGSRERHCTRRTAPRRSVGSSERKPRRSLRRSFKRWPARGSPTIAGSCGAFGDVKPSRLRSGTSTRPPIRDTTGLPTSLARYRASSEVPRAASPLPESGFKRLPPGSRRVENLDLSRRFRCFSSLDPCICD
jgi:hypothetical protein